MLLYAAAEALAHFDGIAVGLTENTRVHVKVLLLGASTQLAVLQQCVHFFLHMHILRKSMSSLSL